MLELWLTVVAVSTLQPGSIAVLMLCPRCHAD